MIDSADATPGNAKPQSPARIYKPSKTMLACIQDIGRGLAMVHVWRTFAVEDVQQRYRRSFFGLAWIFISFLLFVFGIAFFFGNFNQQGSGEFLAYVSIGYACFLFITGVLVDGSVVFVQSQTWIKSINMPLSVHVYRSIFRSLFIFAINMIVAIVIMAMFGWRPNIHILLAIPAFAAYLINAVALQYLVGIVGARYQDITHLISSVTRILIFITPILWVREEQTGARAVAADLNPLTHYVEIFRSPILGQDPRPLSWFIVLCMTALLWLLTLVIGARWRDRLPYWL